MIEVVCECGHLSEAPKKLAGGLVNCPNCGRATSVPGLRDPMWRLFQLFAVVIWAGFVVAGHYVGGLPVALAFAVGVGALFVLLAAAQ